MKPFSILFIVVCLCCTCFSQQQYKFTVYTQEQGLPTATLFGNILKDPEGYLWIGSEDWIARFNGYSFKVFRHNPDDSNSMPPRTIAMLKMTPDNTIFFGGSAGMRYYDPRDYGFHTFPFFGDTLGFEQIFKLRSDPGADYAIARSRLYRIDHKKNRFFRFFDTEDGVYTNLAHDSVRRAIIYTNTQTTASTYLYDARTQAFDRVSYLNRLGKRDSSVGYVIVYCKADDLFYAISREKLYRFDTTSKCFLEVQRLPKFALLDVVPGHPMFLNDRYIFQHTSTGEYYKLDLQTRAETVFHLNKKIPDENVLNRWLVGQWLDDNGRIWITSAGIGVIRFDPATDEWEQFVQEAGNPNSLPSNTTGYLLPDKNGVVWVSCAGAGLVKMEPETPVLKKVLPHVGADSSGAVFNEIRCFLENGKGYLAGSLSGLFEYDTSRGIFSPADELFPDHRAKGKTMGALARDRKGNTWTGTWWSQLSVYSPTTKKTIALHLPLPAGVDTDRIWFRHLYCDHAGAMWISTYGAGLYRVNEADLNTENPSLTKYDVWVKHDKDSSSLSCNYVFVVGEDADGQIWVDTEDGLNRFRPSDGKWKRYYNIRGNAGSLHNSNVRAFALDRKGRFWIGTNGGGLNRYNPVENNFTYFTAENGLPENNIYSLVCDDDGMLWLGTNRGLGRFDPDRFTCKNFSDKDGIQHYEFNTGAALKLSNGLLLFGGVAGYNVIDPSKIENKRSSPPAVAITSFKVFEKEIPPGDGHHRFSFRENTFTFEFAALSYYHNQENKYAYQLVGVDNDWVYCDTRRVVHYPKLAPGEYTFRVKACNSDGVWNETGAQLQFTITPPWWQTSWAKLIFVVLAAGSLIGYFRYRTHAYRVEQKELETKVNEATVTIRKQKEAVEAEKKRSDELLLNILPEEVAEELKTSGSAAAKHFDIVTVMFTDFKDFTQIAEKLSPSELVAEIHQCFKAFDEIISKYNIEKIKTIGDSYMCAGGLPVPNSTNATDVVRAAIEIRHYMTAYMRQRNDEHKPLFEIRIGIHTGPVVAGIVGVKKFAYDIWGDTVNIASRMESLSEVGKINISGATYDLVKDSFQCTYRGKISAKGKGEVDMYFVEPGLNDAWQ